jgi:hypothetical protein
MGRDKAGDIHLKATETTGCCRTTDEGALVCDVTKAGHVGGCGCKTEKEGEVVPFPGQDTSEAPTSIGESLRGGVMMGVACLTSPCCTPLLVPLFLALIAGTPLALWLNHYLGWVYGGLTLISIVTFLLGMREFGRRISARSALIPSTTISITPVLGETNPHAN